MSICASPPRLDTPPMGDGLRAPLYSDLRLLGIGLNEVEAEHASLPTIFEFPGLYEWLFELGISGDAIGDVLDAFDYLAAEAVVFLPGGRFEFAKHMRDATGAKLALIIPALDELGEAADVVAIDRRTGAAATWLGRVAMLGQHRLSQPTLGEPIDVHESAVGWLRACRNGICILDFERARPLLLGRSLAVARTAFGIELRSALTLPPQIFVRGAA